MNIDSVKFSIYDSNWVVFDFIIIDKEYNSIVITGRLTLHCLISFSTRIGPDMILFTSRLIIASSVCLALWIALFICCFIPTPSIIDNIRLVAWHLGFSKWKLTSPAIMTPCLDVANSSHIGVYSPEMVGVCR